MIHMTKNALFTLLFGLMILTFASAIDRINRIPHLYYDDKQHKHRYLFTKNQFIDWIRRIFKKRKQTSSPTKSPTRKPSKSPTKIPTKAPTKIPTRSPTKTPTKAPTKVPTKAPNAASLEAACGFLGISNIATCQSTTFFAYASDAVGTTIPTEIGLLTQLYFVDLADEGLLGKIPSSISDLTKLEVLFLNGNKLTGTIPSSLNRLTALRELYLYNNPGLAGSIPSNLCNSTTAGINKSIYITCGTITCTCCKSDVLPFGAC